MALHQSKSIRAELEVLTFRKVILLQILLQILYYKTNQLWNNFATI